MGRELIQVPMVDDAGRATLRPRRHRPGARRAAPGSSCTSTRTTRSAACSPPRSSWPWPTSSRHAGARVFADEIHAPLVYPGAVHRPVRLAVRGHRRAHGDRHLRVQGVEPARSQGGATGAQQRRRRRALGAGRLPVLPRRRDAGGARQHRRLPRGRAWLDGVLRYLDRNRRLLADLLAEQLPQVRYDRPRAPISPGWTAGTWTSGRGPARSSWSTRASPSSTVRSAGRPERGTCGSTSRPPARADGDRRPDGRVRVSGASETAASPPLA